MQASEKLPEGQRWWRWTADALLVASVVGGAASWLIHADRARALTAPALGLLAWGTDRVCRRWRPDAGLAIHAGGSDGMFAGCLLLISTVAVWPAEATDLVAFGLVDGGYAVGAAWAALRARPRGEPGRPA